MAGVQSQGRARGRTRTSPHPSPRGKSQKTAQPPHPPPRSRPQTAVGPITGRGVACLRRAEGVALCTPVMRTACLRHDGVRDPRPASVREGREGGTPRGLNTRRICPPPCLPLLRVQGEPWRGCKGQSPLPAGGTPPRLALRRVVGG